MLYLAGAYPLLPVLWTQYAHRHPALEDMPGITYTADGIPGDPLNVTLVGTKAEVIRILLAAQWSLRSCLVLGHFGGVYQYF
jgi:hypothetical protein